MISPHFTLTISSLMLTRFFKLAENNTSIKIEMLAGASTFVTMAYICFINPAILALTGMDQGAVFVATCLAAAIGSALMGLLANYPIALAPGMGLNAYFTYGVVLGGGHSWQVALGAVFISGLLFLAISLSPLREYIIRSIPKSLKMAMVAGIGLFLCIIGFKNSGLIVSSQATLVTLGNLHQPTVLLAIAGFFLMIALEAKGFISAILVSILTITLISTCLGYNHFHGFVSMPPSLMPTLLQMDIKGALHLGLLTIVFAFLFVDLFDATGTLIGLAHRMGFITPDGKLPRLKQAMLADSSAAIISATLGTSSTTSYLESAVGIKVGGRTGLTAVVVAILFLVTLFFSPLATSIPLYASAPALIYVAFLMAKSVVDIQWDDVTEYVPAMITVLTMPLTFSIADGIAFGFIAYVAIKLLSGRYRDLNTILVLLALAFIAKYTWFV